MDGSEDIFIEEGRIIANRWKVVRRIGGGGFGEIYEAKDLVTQNKTALKMERTEQVKLVLKMEVAVLKSLQGTNHVCKFYGCGKNEAFNYMVMSLQGKNLSELRKSTSTGVFTISTTVRLGKQILNCLRDVHKAGFLHRDIKPANFAMGRLPSTYRNVYILDFGLSRQYVTNEGDIKTPRQMAGFRGTVKYASYNVHQNKEQGRHDDLFSMLYMMIEMVSGQLPWRKIKNKDEVGRLKQTIESSVLLEFMPREFKTILHYIQELSYFDEPQYSKIDQIFDSILERRQISIDEPFDWEGAIIVGHKSGNTNAIELQSKITMSREEPHFTLLNDMSYFNHIVNNDVITDHDYFSAYSLIQNISDTIKIARRLRKPMHIKIFRGKKLTICEKRPLSNNNRHG